MRRTGVFVCMCGFFKDIKCVILGFLCVCVCMCVFFKDIKCVIPGFCMCGFFKKILNASYRLVRRWKVCVQTKDRLLL